MKDIRVLTNHPKKVVALEGYGIRIADQVPPSHRAAKPNHRRRNNTGSAVEVSNATT